MARSKLLLEAHLKALRLPTFLREYDKLVLPPSSVGGPIVTPVAATI